MTLIKGIIKDFINFFNLKTKPGRIRAAVLVLILVAVAVFLQTKSTNEVVSEENLPKTVFVGSVNTLSGSTNFSVIGQVESLNQAKIQNETAGRVTNVYVELGEQLRAGQIIAELENRSQYASLLQAEGAYEAAQAAAAQSNLSVDTAENNFELAKNSAVNTYNSTYNSLNGAVLNTVDDFFAPIKNERTTRVLIWSDGRNLELSDKRIYFQDKLEEFQAKTISINTQSDLKNELTELKSFSTEVLFMIDALVDITSDDDSSDTLDGQDISIYRSELITQRSAITGLMAGLDNTISELSSAEKALAQAKIGGTNLEVSSANAQLKQALGSLRAAEASYQKTIIRTPIAGTLNELKVKTGDFIGQYTDVALVANNNAQQITAFVGDFDVERISVGDTVILDGDTEGVISAIAPAVDSVTKKTEIKIGTENENLKTGDTVTVTFSQTVTDDSSGPIYIPITAIKFTATDGSIFVVSNGVLESVSVDLGAINGSFVEITKGVDMTTEFVLDARGLASGQKVEAVKK